MPAPTTNLPTAEPMTWQQALTVLLLSLSNLVDASTEKIKKGKP